MGNAETADATTQCKALTADGERCSRPAQEDGFCFQHDEDDPTVSESDDETEESAAESEEQDAEEENGGGEEQEQGQEEEQDEQEQSDTDQPETDQTDEETHMASNETTDPGDVDTDDFDVEVESKVDADRIEGVLAIRRTVVSTAGELIGHEFDGVSEISPTDEGWCAVVEVVERSSIPDTQDVLGRYEIDLDTDGVVQGYRRLDRYRRGDTTAFE